MPKVLISLQYLCNISTKMWRMNLIFCLEINVKASSTCYYHFECVSRDAQITQNNKFTISLQYLKKESSDEVYFLNAGKYENLLQVDIWGWSRVPKVPKIVSLQCRYNISKKKLKLKLIFCMQSCLKTYFSTLGIKVSFPSKVDIIIINGHDQLFSNYSK